MSLCHVYRQIRSHGKKVRKAKAKKNKELAERLLNRMPNYKLNRLILERFQSLN
jgi:pescadillo